MCKEIVGIILAGGKSRRMGTNKAFLEIGGMPLIEREVKILSPLFPTVAVVSKELEKFRFMKGVSFVKDLFPEQHALGGIYTALSHFRKDCFVFACDLPFLNPHLIQAMIAQENGYEVLIPKSRHGLEPLYAIYTGNCLPILEKQIRHSRWSLELLVQQTRLRVFDSTLLHSLDPKELSFFNVNTSGQLRKAQGIQCLFDRSLALKI